MAEAKDSLGIKLAAYAIIICMIPTFIGIFDGATTLLRQTVFWLKFGDWQTDTAWNGLHRWWLIDRPQLACVIPNRILNWVLDGPRWFWMPAFGLAYMAIIMTVLIVGGNYVEDYQKRHGGGSQ